MRKGRPMRTIRARVYAAGLAFATLLFLGHAARAEPCQRDSFEGRDAIVCTIDPATSDLRLFWRDASGAPYGRFDALARALDAKGQKLAFAINAGMYDTDYAPVGLHMEDGAELHPADTVTMDRPPGEVPNFYKQPNGVFYLSKAGAGILPTAEFLKTRPEARFATQSGPMLVIEGRLHPAFIPNSDSRTRRSGVGVCEKGQVRFAISETDVNFDEFARLFRDHLACPNALFLDGGRGSGLYAPALGRNDVSGHGGYGPILGLVE